MEELIGGFSVIFVIFFMIIQMFLSFVPFFIIVVVLTTLSKRTKNTKFFKQNVIINDGQTNNKTVFSDVHKDTLNRFGIDNINDMKDYLYKMFFEFENAYNNLDLDTMKRVSYKQLYENYITGIKLDKNLGKKKVISDITPEQLLLTGLDSTNMKQVATMVITIKYLNYVVDKNGDLISGDRVSHITETFEVVYRKDLEDKPINCPNCGGKIDADDLKCDYCDTVVSSEQEFRIYSIKKIITK